jgi:hypothetical protein
MAIATKTKPKLQLSFKKIGTENAEKNVVFILKFIFIYWRSSLLEKNA